ncbi:MAG TPA: hypothetical protein VFU22_25730 [Roseiflexaceae bacterium]|nr:hypothetical protein [Roseiflexaceae bacterium]
MVVNPLLTILIQHLFDRILFGRGECRVHQTQDRATEELHTHPDDIRGDQ